MSVSRMRATTNQAIHAGELGCLGRIDMKPWIPRGADAVTARVVRRGVCERCGKVFFDPGQCEVSDDDLEAGRPA